MKSKRELEREISLAIIRFEKEFMGRGPLETRAYIIEDMVLVRLKNVLTPAEFRLAESEDGPRWRYLIKQVRQELIEKGRPLLDAVIKDILDVKVVSLHTDISAKSGESSVISIRPRAPYGPNQSHRSAADSLGGTFSMHNLTFIIKLPGRVTLMLGLLRTMQSPCRRRKTSRSK